MKQILIICLIILPGTKLCFAQTAPRWKTLPDIPALPNADTSGLAIVNGARLYFAVFNKTGKDPVILLHGGFSSSEDWGFEVPLLANTHQVIVMDTRGHGRSTMDDQPFSYDLFASDVKGLMDMLRVPKASVVGWSDGGITGLVMAMKYPAYIKNLFTYGSNYNKSGEKDEPFDSALAAKFMNRVKENYRRLSPTPDGFPNLRMRIIKLYSTQPNLDTTALRRIRLPVVIGCGEYEQFYTQEHFESLAKLIPGARLVVMPAVSHGGPIQDPITFHKEVSLLVTRDVKY
jgi:pimeloyl-ACP methyl ester carboxylesterase